MPTISIYLLNDRIPAWMGLWFSMFPTIETLTVLVIVLILVLGSYFVTQRLQEKKNK